MKDTTTSTCWSSKCLRSQLLSFLLNLWAPPLVAIGTCETQGLRETMTLLRGLFGGCQGHALGGSVSGRPIPCLSLCLWHAEWEQCGQILQPSLPHKNFTFSPAGHAQLAIWLCPVTAKCANNQGENVHISNSTTPTELILVSRDSWRIALTLWG